MDNSLLTIKDDVGRPGLTLKLRHLGDSSIGGGLPLRNFSTMPQLAARWQRHVHPPFRLIYYFILNLDNPPFQM